MFLISVLTQSSNHSVTRGLTKRYVIETITKEMCGPVGRYMLALSVCLHKIILQLIYITFIRYYYTK